MTSDQEFPLHKAAKGSLYLVAFLCCVLIITIPLGIFFFLRVRRAGVTVTPSGVKARGFLTKSFEFADVTRFGLVKIPLVARGAAAAVARAKLGGLDYGLNVVVQTRDGKTVKFITNQYERHDALISMIQRSIKVPAEDLSMGAFGIKWPAAA